MGIKLRDYIKNDSDYIISRQKILIERLLYFEEIEFKLKHSIGIYRTPHNTEYKWNDEKEKFDVREVVY